MYRRRFLLTSVAALAVPGAAGAQPRMPRIGLLSSGADVDPAKPGAWSPFFQQLRALGHVEGKTVAFERRFGGGRPER